MLENGAAKRERARYFRNISTGVMYSTYTIAATIILLHIPAMGINVLRNHATVSLI